MLRAVTRNALVSWAHYAFALGSALILTPWILHDLGPAAYGLWILLTQLGGYSGLLELGTQPAVARDVAQAEAMGDRERVRLTVRSALWLQLCVALLLLIAAAFVGPFLLRWVDLGGVDPRSALLAFALIVATMAISLPSSVFAAGLRGLQRLDLVAYGGIGATVVRITVVLVALRQRWGVAGLALASVMAASAMAVSAGAFLRARTGALFERLRPSSTVIRGHLTFGTQVMVGTAGWYLAYGTDSLLIGTFLTARDVAHFGLAASVLIMISAIVGGVSASFLPLASEASARQDLVTLRRHYVLGTRVCLFLSLPLLASLVLAGPVLLSWWVGPEVGVPAGAVLRVLAIAHLPVIANSAGMQVALGLGLPGRAALITLAEGLSNLLLSLALIRPFGTIGVAVGTLVPSLLFNGLVWPATLRRRLGPGSTRLWRVAWLPNLAAVAVGVVAFAVVGLLPVHGSAAGFARVVALIAVTWAIGLKGLLSALGRRVAEAR